MATHSSVLAWRIPGTEEPGGLPSNGLHRVRHDWSDVAAAAAAAADAGDIRNMGSIPESGRSPGGGQQLRYSCLQNPTDRGTWGATVHGVSKSQTWHRDLTKKQHRYHEMITAIRLIIITPVISYTYLLKKEKKRKKNTSSCELLHRAACASSQYGSCVLRVFQQMRSGNGQCLKVWV